MVHHIQKVLEINVTIYVVMAFTRCIIYTIYTSIWD